MTREEAIEELEARKEHYEMDDDCDFLVEALEKGIEALKNQKTGHWIDDTVGGWFKCSSCNEISLGRSLYCPHCGAEMEIKE